MLEEETQLQTRQRLAWVILIGSFFICVVITISIPITASAFIQNATRELLTTVQANQGTVGIDDETGVRRALIVAEPPQPVAPGASILTDATASALMLIAPPENSKLLARLKIDSNTTLHLQEASAPRFGLSNADQFLNLELDSGRLRLSLLDDSERALVVDIMTPQGDVVIQEAGEYSLQVNNEATQVSVQDGLASVTAVGETLALAPDQRAEIPTGAPPRGPLTPERNLVHNGDFSAGFDNWAEYTWRVELGDQPKGKTEIIPIEGEPVLRFSRVGVGHADAQVRQSINQTVSDSNSLRVALTFRILEQSLGVCGVQGSECPLFLRIEYKDQNGASQVWQNGFYAAGVVNDNATPGACISCAVIQSNHIQVPIGQDFFYEVNLPEALARQGALPPGFINNISLVASGHSFATDIVDVAIIID